MRASTADAMLPTESSGQPIAGYVESSRGGRFAEAARYVRSYPEQLPLPARLLPQIFTPVQIITGRKDPLVARSGTITTEGVLPLSQYLI
jgi:hypothetical protein